MEQFFVSQYEDMDCEQMNANCNCHGGDCNICFSCQSCNICNQCDSGACDRVW